MTCRVSANPEGSERTSLELKAALLATRQYAQRGESAFAEIEAAAAEATLREVPKCS